MIYLRAAVGLLPGYTGTLSDVARLSDDLYRQAQPLSSLPLPSSLLTVEVLREAATMLVLLAVAILSTQRQAEGITIFLWMFALWDIGYYVVLWSTVRWPSSLTSPDVPFFIPVPWIAQVWFPILISTLTLAVVLVTRHRDRLQ